MDDYISRETILNNKVFLKGGDSRDHYVCGYLDALDDVEKAIDAIPAADVVKVRHGTARYSMMDEYYGEWYRCSVCGCDAITDIARNYCPDCGAKLDKT